MGSQGNAFVLGLLRAYKPQPSVASKRASMWGVSSSTVLTESGGMRDLNNGMRAPEVRWCRVCMLLRRCHD